MAYNNYQQVPFWDFVHSFDASGAGVDHPAAGSFPYGPSLRSFHQQAQNPFMFGGPQTSGHGPFPHGHGHGHGFGRGGHRGRHCRRREGGDEGAREARSPSATAEASGDEAREAGEDVPQGPRGPHHRGGRRGGWHGRGGHRGPPGAAGFDLNGLFETLSAHPLAQAFRSYAEQSGFGANGQRSGDDADKENTFTPPIDVFSTEKEFVLHVALPGAKKEDVGVNWDADKGVLNVAGVVYRQGDEEFLKSLSKSERKVGMFERDVKLPPGDEEKDEVDADHISAKLEDGVLVVVVPKLEKEWTDVKRVDIE